MAKELTFELAGTQYGATPSKLDRKKIYGWGEIVATDRNGESCNAAYLSAEDSIIIPSGGLKLAVTDDDGNWVDKTSLITCNERGIPLPIHKSSFDAPILLHRKVTLDEFIDNHWESVYQLCNQELADSIGDNIYYFPFSYRGGTTISNGYLLNTPNGLFLFTGEKQEFPILTLSDQSVISDDEVEEDIDDLDFGMF